jgi:hypothetical protein
MLHVQRETEKACAKFEAGENQFVERDGCKTSERYRQGVMVK